MNESKHPLLIDVLVTRNAEIVRQVSSCDRMSEVGSLRWIRGRITTLDVKLTTTEQHGGSSKARHLQNGRYHLILLCGFMENVCAAHSRASDAIDNLDLIAGAGKSFLSYVNFPTNFVLGPHILALASSSIIEEIDGMRKSGLASLRFYYFDFWDDEKKHRHGLLSLLLFQLCDQSATYCNILSRLYSTQHNGSQSPSDSDLAQCLEDMLHSPGQAPVYLVIDALDECPNSFDTPSPRENVLKLVEHLVNLRLQNLRICLTSRPEVDIKAVLDHLVFHSISLHDEEGQKQDILDYITSVVHTDCVTASPLAVVCLLRLSDR
jgi:hypothetical protein